MIQTQPITANSSNSTAVQVALRVRPLTSSDRSQPRFSHSTNSDVIKAYDKSVAIVPHQKTFQFDHVFDANSTQDQVFKSVASNFVDRFIDGYNVTILAYGQTSSGKTYTMGTAMDEQSGSNPEQEGIIPRAMSALFHRLQDIQKESSPPITPTNTKRASVLATFPPTSGLRAPKKSASNVKLRPVSMITPPRRGSNATIPITTTIPSGNDKTTRYSVHVSFIEIYNEELIDLLNPAPPHERTPVTIREDTKGHIIWTGLKEVPVSNTEDVLRYLQLGTENRATGSTDMNAKSSRSHAIFSVTLKQEKWVSSPSASNKPVPTKSITTRHSTLNVKALIGQMEKQAGSVTPPADDEQGDWMVVNSKFHFVDLAGSERLKRTAAEGDRRKEGININAGLLALGNVISALSDPSKKSTHVPYRDSKLTRLLQDSLGGNSTTLMIACISPAEINLTETINTIKYAYRARNIRNKTERNETEEWMTSDNLDHLRTIISKLKAEVKSLKSIQRNTPSPLSSSTTKSMMFANGIVSPSSSLSDNDHPHPSTCPSMSATTTITIPESATSLEMFEAQTPLHSNDIAVMVSDLHRQIEELQNEVTVTRERNQLVERELVQKTDIGGPAFQHLVEPVIEEYEKSISGLESQLAMARAALSHSDQALTEQQEKIDVYQQIQTTEIKSLQELKDHLHIALEREKNSEVYCLELESQLEKSVHDGQRDQQVLSELREKIIKFKDMDDHTEQYISDLETRLSKAENERVLLTERITQLAERSNEETRELHTIKSVPDVVDQEKESLLKKELLQCQTKCEELDKELQTLKEKLEKRAQSNQSIDIQTATQIAQLVAEKETQVSVLDSQLQQIENMKLEHSQLRDSHEQQVNELQSNLDEFKLQCTTYQTRLQDQQGQCDLLQEKMDLLVDSSESNQQELEKVQFDYNQLKQCMSQQEESTQNSLQQSMDQLQKFELDLNALRLVEEKQDAIIEGLELKLEEMDHLVSSLRTQLDDRNQMIEHLEADNTMKSELAADMKKQLDGVLKDVCGMGVERKNLEKVMSFMEGTLRLQDAKSDKSMETLEDIKHHYKVREEEIEEKRRTVNLLSAEKEQLSQSLEQISQRASQGDVMMKNLVSELSQARLSLSEQYDLVNQLKEEQRVSNIELEKVQLLETRVQQLDKEVQDHQLTGIEKQKELTQIEELVQIQLLQNERLVKTIEELENGIKQEQSLASAKDSIGMITELENKLVLLQESKKREDDLWTAQMESAEEELFMSRKENQAFKLKIESLEESISAIQNQVSGQKLGLDDYQDVPTTYENEVIELDEQDDSSSTSSQQGLIEKILQLQEDNTQLLKHNDNLESQLVLQRGQLTLETKNLELELMKLTAANDRLEKEMEQVIPRNNGSNFISRNRDSMQFTSPPQTPRVASPPPPHPTASSSTGSIIHYKLQRDISTSSIAKLSKSGSYRSVSTILQDNHLSNIDDDNMKRLSSISMKSDVLGGRPSSSFRTSRTVMNSSSLPPPTAPPSNPLPPIPTPLPPLPNSPSPPSIHGSSIDSEPGSPTIPPTTTKNASSQSSLHRCDSTASTSFSDIMNATSASNFTSDQYDKLIRSLQRKAQFAENDVRAHQEVITKLESQLTKSECSVRDIRKQLDLLSREKQAYNLEIQNLRSQVTQIQSQHQNTSEESVHERKALEDQLEEQKALKEKAEKARRILENRMDEIMNKKSKFMCF
ncbi:hypothetical protein EDC94DRAFT_596739 [Helicostylum pulchrum]|nr:hypothetical protein EDC94DRAFT_596739 [Helicostylum pulchrum]